LFPSSWISIVALSPAERDSVFAEAPGWVYPLIVVLAPLTAGNALFGEMVHIWLHALT
jgi:hypothetical protein